jgi:hypothetical protein
MDRLTPDGEQGRSTEWWKTQRFRLWLDGGYDRELVEECEYHPDHRWEVVKVAAVAAEGLASEPTYPDDVMVICRGCFVPRCGEATYRDRDGNLHYEQNPCLLPRHHREPHEFADGRSREVGAPLLPDEGSSRA